MHEDLEIDYNDQFFLAFRRGFDMGAAHGSGSLDDSALWIAFLEYLEEGDEQ